jgi:hypothetical protein
MFSHGKQQKAYAATSIDAATKQHILSATVRIVFYAPLLDKNGQPQIVKAKEQQEAQYVAFKSKDGLGTMVNMNGETVIVTHDHWTFQDKLKMARFYDAGGVLLEEMDSDEFHQLIRYRDGGTMILALPTQLEAPAVIGNARIVQPEDVVLIAYKTPKSSRLDVLEMRVTNVYKHHGRNVFALVSPDGEVVNHGNSGGGVWYRGKLVGNMWGTIQKLLISKEQGNALKSTDRSIAAMLPVGAIP